MNERLESYKRSAIARGDRELLEIIEQAERVEELVDKLYALDEIALQKQMDFLEINGKKNHYKQALEEIINQHGNESEIDDNDFMWNVWKIANDALKGETK